MKLWNLSEKWIFEAKVSKTNYNQWNSEKRQLTNSVCLANKNGEPFKGIREDYSIINVASKESYIIVYRKLPKKGPAKRPTTMREKSCSMKAIIRKIREIAFCYLRLLHNKTQKIHCNNKMNCVGFRTVYFSVIYFW